MAIETYAPLNAADLTPDELRGTPVYGPEDAKVGSVSEFEYSPDDRAEAAIVDVGGFLGIGAKPVLIPFSELHFSRDETGSLRADVRWTKDELKAQAEYQRADYEQDVIDPVGRNVPPML